MAAVVSVAHNAVAYHPAKSPNRALTGLFVVWVVRNTVWEEQQQDGCCRTCSGNTGEVVDPEGTCCYHHCHSGLEEVDENTKHSEVVVVDRAVVAGAGATVLRPFHWNWKER